MFDLSAMAPDNWNAAITYEENADLRVDGDFLSEDFCVLNGTDFFVRCVLEVPVLGMRERFGFGCWGTLSKPNFDMYVRQFDGGADPAAEPWGSWLSNRLYPFVDDEPTACWMQPRADRMRPTLHVQDPDHPLAAVQQNGISAEQVLEIYAYYGHEVKS